MIEYDFDSDEIRGEPRELWQAMAKLVRFGGRLCGTNTVASHSLRVVDAFEAACPELRRYAVFALLHDAHEVFTGDIGRAFRAYAPQFCGAETRVNHAIHRFLRLPTIGVRLWRQISEAITRADDAVNAVEYATNPWGAVSAAKLEIAFDDYSRRLD